MKEFKNGTWVGGIEPGHNESYLQVINGLNHVKKHSTYVPPALAEIKIMSITNDIKHNGALTRVTCNELTNVIIGGTLDYPDTLFAMPIRRDDGRLFLFPAQITNGAFSVVINLPTSGQFTYSDNECNIDLPTPLFTVKTLRIDCLRKIEVI